MKLSIFLVEPNSVFDLKQYQGRIIMFYLIIFGFVAGQSTMAQGTFIPLGHDSYRIIDRFDIKYGKVLPIPHTGLKPYSRRSIAEYAQSLRDAGLHDINKHYQYNLAYLLADNGEWIDSAQISSKRPILRHFYTYPDALYSKSAGGLDLKINPVLHLHMGKEFGESEMRFSNVRGIEMRAYIRKKVGFYLYVTDTQTRWQQYVQQKVRDSEAVPGEGFFKTYRETGIDYFTARGYMTFNVLKHFDIQFGHDKHFIGNGYRSLFLSDYANNYFFLKLNTRVWRVNYQSIFAELTGQYDRGEDRLLDKKYAAFHHFNVNVTHFLDIGFFEGVVMARENQFDIQYLNPIIFFRSIEQDLGSPDNAFVGFDFKINFLNHFSVYSQFVFDEFNSEHIRARDGWWGNKFGFQSGIKYIDAAAIDHLDLQLEFNMMRPFTYTHNTDPDKTLANYTHYNQPMAHPLGANFREVIALVRYQPLDKLTLELTYISALKGLDSLGFNWGGDIFKPTNGTLAQQEFGNEIGQGYRTTTNLVRLNATYQLRHNLNFDFQFMYRKRKSDLVNRNVSSTYLGVGARLNIPAKKHDF